MKLEIETLDETWLAQLKDEVTSKDFLELKRFLKKEIASGKEVFPPLEDVYSWCVLRSYLFFFASLPAITRFKHSSHDI